MSKYDNDWRDDDRLLFIRRKGLQSAYETLRDVSAGKSRRLKRNLYETDPSTPGILLAQAIYGPSHISFDYAPSYYGMIPEYASNVTSATIGEHKDKRSDTDFCSFYYPMFPQGSSRKKAVCVEKTVTVTTSPRGKRPSAIYCTRYPGDEDRWIRKVTL